MKITILSGSPKGKHSVSLQSVKFLEKKFDEHNYEFFDIAKNIKKIESQEDEFNKIIQSVENSDMVIWVTPVYTFLIPSQFKKFIELVFEKKQTHAFKNKFTGVVTTSINFFDHCAHNYMKSICEDLNMKFCGGFSADSYDLLDENQRLQLFNFGKILFDNAKKNRCLQKIYPKVNYQPSDYQEPQSVKSFDTQNKNILLIQDKDYKDHNLGKMINTFLKSINNNAKVINLSSLDIKGGCTGCVQCGFDHQCMYEGADDFIPVFSSAIKESDIIIFAGEIKDRWLSAKWKEFFDRSFFQNHVPVMKDKQIAMMISGPFSQMSNLKEVLDSFTQWQRANLIDIISDEFTEDTYQNIINLAETAIEASLLSYVAPAKFPGKGGHKIFRDDIWGRHRFVFQQDHQWYEQNGFYDFPQYDEKAIEMSENMIKLTADPEMRQAIRKMLKTEMVKPHIKIVEQS